MLWRITCYNGTVWEPASQCSLSEAPEQFKRETGLSDWDIKTIVNNH